jgi:hypothetical protein
MKKLILTLLVFAPLMSSAAQETLNCESSEQDSTPAGTTLSVKVDYDMEAESETFASAQVSDLILRGSRRTPISFSMQGKALFAATGGVAFELQQTKSGDNDKAQIRLDIDAGENEQADVVDAKLHLTDSTINLECVYQD